MAWMKAHARLLVLLGIAIGVALLALDGARRVTGPNVVAPASRAAPRAPAAVNNTAATSTAPGSVPQVDMTRLAQRTAKGPERDLFGSRDWRPAAPPKAAPLPAPPQDEPLPPVPYTYLGRCVEGRATVVLLGREGRSYLARVNDVLDDAYRVDGIEPARIVLTYLPRNAVQSIAIARQGGAPAAAAPSANPPGGAGGEPDAILRVTIAERAAIGEEVTVRVNLDPVKASLIERGSVEVRYDPTVLNAVGRSGAAAGADPGRVTLDVAGGHVGHGGPPAVARLRVVAQTGAQSGATAPLVTQITLANVYATDGESNPVAVRIDGPNPRPLTIVRTPK